jgi:hypothetical protein
MMQTILARFLESVKNWINLRQWPRGLADLRLGCGRGVCWIITTP